MGLADVDGDGDLDLLIGNSGQPNRLYLSNGSGVFSSFTNVTSDAHKTLSLCIGDVDGDGDLDLIAGNNSGQVNRVYFNGGGPVSETTQASGLLSVSNVNPGDEVDYSPLG